MIIFRTTIISQQLKIVRVKSIKKVQMDVIVVRNIIICSWRHCSYKINYKGANCNWHTAKWQACLRRHSKIARANTNGKSVIVTIRAMPTECPASHIGNFRTIGNTYVHVYILTHTHTHTYTHTHINTYSLSLSLTHTHTHIHMYTTFCIYTRICTRKFPSKILPSLQKSNICLRMLIYLRADDTRLTEM